MPLPIAIEALSAITPSAKFGGLGFDFHVDAKSLPPKDLSAMTALLNGNLSRRLHEKVQCTPLPQVDPNAQLLAANLIVGLLLGAHDLCALNGVSHPSLTAQFTDVPNTEPDNFYGFVLGRRPDITIPLLRNGLPSITDAINTFPTNPEILTAIATGGFFRS